MSTIRHNTARERREAEVAAARSGGMRYREVFAGLVSTREDVRSRKPQPEVIVKLDLGDDNDEKIIKELLGTEGLMFEIVSIGTEDGVDITLRIRLRPPQV